MSSHKDWNHPKRRKTRIVCISDTHNQTPSLPKGDVLIHAGDLTNQGSLSELRKTVAWLEKADFEVKIVIAGNHDITLDEAFYDDHWSSFHNQHKQDTEVCRALLIESESIKYLQHESAHIKLTSPDGPRTQFEVFGSPYSPTHGLWAFGYKPEEASKVWNEIPADSDIVVTHTPPRNHCDTSVTKTRAGCEGLRRALWRVRPRLAVCGHMHEGRGVERVKWHYGLPTAKYLEESVDYWVDPGAGEGNKKQSIVNIKTESLNKPLNNFDFTKSRKAKNVSFSGEGDAVLPSAEEVASLADLDSVSKKIKGHLNRGKKKTTLRDLAKRSSEDESKDEIRESYSRLNDEAVGKEAGNMETCIVNAAIMANSWGGPKRFNKPIVVDLELPVWNEDEEGIGLGE